MNIAIIGCGASALYYAVNDKINNIVIFEKNKKIASKLLASGNGKCNLLNLNAKPSDYNNEEFMKSVFNTFSPKDIYVNYASLGLSMKVDEEGRVYPISESSQNVLNILLKNTKAKIITEYKVNKITKINGKYKINDYDMLFDKIILASGSSANIIKDKQSDCYKYLSDLNIKLTPLKPSLTGFITNNLKEISGIRVKASVKLFNNKKLISTESGEIIFKDDGISGIVVMNMSSRLNRLDVKDPYLEIDLIPGINPKDLEGALNPNLYKYILKNNIDPHKFILNIKSTYDIMHSQVVSGGVDLNMINNDFSYVKDNNIYMMGEMLDIDGICGGYNLLFAFLSASIVLRSINNENSNKRI